MEQSMHATHEINILFRHSIHNVKTNQSSVATSLNANTEDEKEAAELEDGVDEAIAGKSGNFFLSDEQRTARKEYPREPFDVKKKSKKYNIRLPSVG
mmetsp:Transcript_14018/g.20525  ORF Transcript_14018/g.20525 Transcript_14018/m.20525 type:complete len:97 (-) Transcript_14018:81-371(-)